MIENTGLFIKIVLSLSLTIVAFWLVSLILLSGDIHPNPGPITPSNSTSSSNISTVAFNSLNLTHNLSIVHYSVQSIFSKIEILHTELIDFDILTFSETWLSDSVENDDLMLQS